MDLKAILTSMLLIGVGVVLVSQQPIPRFEIVQWIGWLPFTIGMLVLGLSIKKEITA